MLAVNTVGVDCAVSMAFDRFLSVSMVYALTERFYCMCCSYEKTTSWLEHAIAEVYYLMQKAGSHQLGWLVTSFTFAWSCSKSSCCYVRWGCNAKTYRQRSPVARLPFDINLYFIYVYKAKVDDWTKNCADINEISCIQIKRSAFDEVLSSACVMSYAAGNNIHSLLQSLKLTITTLLFQRFFPKVCL